MLLWVAFYKKVDIWRYNVGKVVMRIMNNNCLNEKAIEIIHAIADIDEQLNSSTPDYDKLCSITIKAKNKFPNETYSYELAKFVQPETIFIPINQMTLNELLDRLVFYRNLYVAKLAKDYGSI